ncbi:MAG TPA: hypothetical protein VNO82_15860, partial [Solirubrobacteraceae bacterium]|nr:hypothetical protein [Solirubrobacteraceae bacterium]
MLVALVGLILTGCGSSGDEPAPARAAAEPTATVTATPAPEGPAAAPRTAIVWGLERPARAARRLRGHPSVAAATSVGRGVVLLRSGVAAGGRTVQRVEAGYAVPLDVLAVDPADYAATLAEPDRAAFGRLRPGTAILSRTSARLRRLGAGGRLRLADGR